MRADEVHDLPLPIIARYRPIALALMVYLLVMAEPSYLSAEESEKGNFAAVDPSGVVDVVSLDESALTESSGLAVSRRREAHFWSHNDSGGKARVFGFDSKGRKTGLIKLNSAEFVDWEDMASFVDDGFARLLIADCGDNNRNRTSIALHLLDEPDPRKSTSAKTVQTVELMYPDGPRDSEAVAVDAHRRKIVLISKTAFPACGVYVVQLPRRVATATRAVVTAQRIATLPLPMVTAMDIDQSNGDIWIVSYFQGFRFRCADRDMSIATQLADLPEPHEMPRWKQIEAIAIDAAQDAWVTSEGSPAPLGRLPQRNQLPRERSTQ